MGTNYLNNLTVPARGLAAVGCEENQNCTTALANPITEKRRESVNKTNWYCEARKTRYTRKSLVFLSISNGARSRSTRWGSQVQVL